MIKKETVDTDSVLMFLPGVDLFNELEGAVLDDMAARIGQYSYDKDEFLIRNGDAGYRMYLIKQGCVSVILQDKEVVLRKGAVVGEMALLSGQPSNADVIAREPTETFVLERQDFQLLMLQYIELASVMTALLKSRMSKTEGIQTLGKYQILGQLGEGGMSIVYDAYDTELEREVAIKMLKYELATADDFRQRFLQEAKIIARLNHPNILHVIETIDDYSTSFIVMEKLDSYELNYYLKHQGVFSSTQTCDILYQVALALEHANNELNGGIIHRDVKLSNVVLDDRGRVKLMDFGIATTSDHSSEHYEGTVLYMAPEILLAQKIDYRVDIYALGIMAFAMLTGKTPFSAASLDQVIEYQLKKAPPDIVNLVPGISSGLAEFIQRALIKDPKQRISSWLEIQELLDSGRRDSVHLDASGEKDMAIVIKLVNEGVDTDELLREIRWSLDRYHVNYEIDIIEREKQDVDFAL